MLQLATKKLVTFLTIVALASFQPTSQAADTKRDIIYQTSPGDYIFLTGDAVEFWNWNTTWDGAAGPMLTPNYPNWFLNVSVPAGQTIQFKFIKIAANSAVTWENGSNHSYTVPTSGTGFVTVNWQN